jgi:hypothetical protein
MVSRIFIGAEVDFEDEATTFTFSHRRMIAGIFVT